MFPRCGRASSAGHRPGRPGPSNPINSQKYMMYIVLLFALSDVQSPETGARRTCGRSGSILFLQLCAHHRGDRWGSATAPAAKGTAGPAGNHGVQVCCGQGPGARNGGQIPRETRPRPRPPRPLPQRARRPLHAAEDTGGSSGRGAAASKSTTSATWWPRGGPCAAPTAAAVGVARHGREWQRHGRGRSDGQERHGREGGCSCRAV